MSGGPSHVDLFDPKPDLIRLAGQPIPESFGAFKTRRNVAKNNLFPPLRPFHKHGQSGIEVSDLLPHLAGHVDDLCLLRGCYGDSVTHPESVYLLNTGSILMGRASLGSWAAYGLGTIVFGLSTYFWLTMLALAVAELSDLISLCAACHAAGSEAVVPALWLAAAIAVGCGGDEGHEAAKGMARTGSSGAVEALLDWARRKAESEGLDDDLDRASELIDFAVARPADSG